jgi:hypothetical protein
MSDNCVSIQVIDSVHPHPNADRLEIIRVLGTQSIVPKNEYKAGDTIVFFPPDTLIPPDKAEVLGVKKYLKEADYAGQKCQCRIAATRLRGIPSYGFVAPSPFTLPVGSDVSKFYHAVKYQPPEPVCLEAAPPHLAFHEYIDIQHYWRYPDRLMPGEPVVLSEKIHGCVRSDTRITMANGTKKRIHNIKVGDYVSGMKDGQIVPSEVLETFDNGTTDKWLAVTIERRKAGRGGNNFGRLRCTPNHQFWMPESNNYLAADKLRVGDPVCIIRTDPGLTPIQHSILLGKLIGDGSLQLHNSGAAHISIGHADVALVDWTARGLGGLLNRTTNATSGYGSTIYRGFTTSSIWIADAFKDFHTDDHKYGSKCVPEWVADALTPLAIAFWYMDDGSLSHQDDQEDRASFAVCRYNKQDCEVLMRGLAKFGVGSVYFQHNGYSRLRLNAEDAERLFLLIAPYIPEALQYKLPERYRGHVGWLPPTSVCFKRCLVPVKVLSIEEDNRAYHRCDIATETHNYFANNLLTHNSNARCGLINTGPEEWKFMVGSHHIRVTPGNNIYWEHLHDHGHLALLCHLCDEQHDVIMFGEVFGPRIQDMDYGVGKPSFSLFDISVDGQYLDWTEVHQLCFMFGVQTVPVLYEGPFDKEILEAHTNGITTFKGVRGKFKGREGVVVKPIKERQDFYGRVILKSVSADYLAR